MKTTHEISHFELNQMVHAWVKDQGLVPEGKVSHVVLKAEPNPGCTVEPKHHITAIVEIVDRPLHRDD